MTKSRLIILRARLEKMVNGRGGILNPQKKEAFNAVTQDLADILDFMSDLIDDRDFWKEHATY